MGLAFPGEAVLLSGYSVPTYFTHIARYRNICLS